METGYVFRQLLLILVCVIGAFSSYQFDDRLYCFEDR